MGLEAIGGGGQFKEAIQQIMTAERQPVKQLEANKAREEAKMKLFQEFKGKFQAFDKVLGDFTSFQNFREFKVDLGDGQNLMSVSVDKTKAQPGTYQFQIDQLAQRASIISNHFEKPDEAVLGVGYLVMELQNGETKEIFIDEDHGSLKGIADVINRVPNAAVRASVVKDDSNGENPYRLIITGKKDGQEKVINFPEIYFLDGEKDFYINDDQSPNNAVVKLDGFEMELDSNEKADFLEGVNIQLKQARPDQVFTINISEDKQKITGKMKGLIDNINGVLEFINKQNTVDEKSDTRSTFAGDTGLTNVEYRLRNLMHEGFPVPTEDNEDWKFMFLHEVGVNFEKNGSISFKEDKFQQALEKDYEKVSEMITGENGFANQLRDVVAVYARNNNNLLQVREQGIKSRIKNYDDQIASKERNLETKQKALTDKFARLQGALGAMQQQQQYVSATLGGGGGNMVQQLLGG